MYTKIGQSFLRLFIFNRIEPKGWCKCFKINVLLSTLLVFIIHRVLESEIVKDRLHCL